MASANEMPATSRKHRPNWASMQTNRFRPGLDRVVCMLAQFGLCFLDVAGISLAEAIDRAQRTSLTTSKQAYYDPVQLDDLITRLAAERGPDFELPCYFNDRFSAGQRGSGRPPTAQQMREALPHSTFAWTTQQDVPFEPLIVHVDAVPDAVQAVI